MNYFFLLLATVAEVFSTSALKASAGFTRPLPSVAVVIGYCCTFYWLSLSLRTVPLSIAYAIWCGGGLALIPAIDCFYFGQKLDLAAYLGLALIFAGVIVLMAFSRSGTQS